MTLWGNVTRFHSRTVCHPRCLGIYHLPYSATRHTSRMLSGFPETRRAKRQDFTSHKSDQKARNLPILTYCVRLYSDIFDDIFRYIVDRVLIATNWHTQHNLKRSHVRKSVLSSRCTFLFNYESKHLRSKPSGYSLRSPDWFGWGEARSSQNGFDLSTDALIDEASTTCVFFRGGTIGDCP